MNHQDLRTFQILEEIGNDHVPSQRELAGKLNVSLGLVNSFMKRLTQKGYFKIRNISRNRIRYILTPKGVAEKTRLTYQYIQYSYGFYKDARQKIRNLFQELAAAGVRRIVFYGIGDIAEIAFLSLQETPIDLAAIVDDLHVGVGFLSRVVAASSELENLSFDKILITANKDREDIVASLSAKGVAGDQVVELE
jgi:DNA-binding MarR family transcriptional regulator